MKFNDTFLENTARALREQLRSLDTDVVVEPTGGKPEQLFVHLSDKEGRIFFSAFVDGSSNKWSADIGAWSPKKKVAGDGFTTLVGALAEAKEATATRQKGGEK
jgi:hypothetical protein